MRSAIRTLYTIWGVLSAILTVTLVSFASLCAATKDDAVSRLVAGGMTEAEAIASANALIATLFIFAFVALCASVYSFVMMTLVEKERVTRVQRNILGAVAIVLLIWLPGILMLVDANRKPKPETVEIKEEEE